MRASHFTLRQAPLPARLEPEAVDAERQQLLALRHRELARELGRCGRAYARAEALHTSSQFTMCHIPAFQLPPMKILGCTYSSGVEKAAWPQVNATTGAHKCPNTSHAASHTSRSTENAKGISTSVCMSNCKLHGGRERTSCTRCSSKSSPEGVRCTLRPAQCSILPPFTHISGNPHRTSRVSLQINGMEPCKDCMSMMP